MPDAVLHASVRSQELTHRRFILAATGTLIALTMSPVFGHHLAAGAEAFLAGRDHLGQLCLLALHELAWPVHRLFHFLIAAGVVYAGVDRIQAWRVQRSVLRHIRASVPAPGVVFRRAAEDVGIDPARIRVCNGLPTPAFTTGLWRPRIYVAAALADRLSYEELVAVLAHEAAHARERDPLRLCALRFLSRMLFWLPVFRRLAEDAADEAEIRADDHAVRGKPLVLASAIVKLSQWQAQGRASIAVRFHTADLVERRVRRLAGQAVAPRSHVNRRSVVSAVAVLLVAWATGVAVTHPLPDASSAHGHCHAHDGTVFSHLFCMHGKRADQDCPHAGLA
jgi:Zn-dependent protease with chaperone function